MSGGVRLTEDSTKIRRTQVADCLNAILRKSGIKRRPGTETLASYNLAAVEKGLHIYRRLDGTEKVIQVAGGKLYEIADDGTPSERYNLTGAGDAFFANYLDKCWITNGASAVKLENQTAYQVGITAPTGATVAKYAGGSLAAGKYTVYISYARQVSGSNVLYSVAQSLGDVTLETTNLTIRISSFANSADGQVNNKVVWMIDPAGTIAYFYHETDDNTTTTVDVTSDTAKNTDIPYSIYGVRNNFPGDGIIPDFDYIHAFDGRILGSSSNILYYSLQNTANVYDLERFFPLNKNVYPYEITGIFSIGENLYLNTPAGIITQPSDLASEWSIVKDRSLYWYHMDTVAPYSQGKIGLTQDGVKYFDGEKFVEYDISYDVRSEIEKIYSSTSGFNPCGAIYRRNIRTEYHLCYNDDDLTTVTNNMRLVLNLNMLEFLPEKRVTAPWELWGNGATHIAIDSNENMYCAQSHATAPKLYKENANNTYDNGIYQRDGTVGTATTEIYYYVTSRTILFDMSAILTWHIIRCMIKQAKTTKITAYIRDVYGKSAAVTINKGTTEGSTVWDAFKWDVDVWDTQTIGLQFRKLPMNFRGYMMYLKIEQTANDIDHELLNLEVNGVAESNRYT